MTDDQDGDPTPRTDAAVTPTEARTAEIAGDPPPGPGRTVPAGALVVAIMVAAAMAVLAIVALTTADGGGEGDDDARFAAGRFTERFLTHDHDALDEWKAAVLELSTPGFAEQVNAQDETLRELIESTELDATTQVTEIFLGEVDRNTVTAVLIYDRELRSTSGTRTETDRYVQLRLVELDGEWLVDDVVDIATTGGLEGVPVAPGDGPPDAGEPGGTAPADPDSGS